MNRDDETLREVSGGSEVGQVEPIEPVEQEQMQITEETMAQVRGTGRDVGRLYENIVRETGAHGEQV